MNTLNTSIVCIDIQEKLIKISKDDELKNNIIKLLKTASILNVDTILTEQYPKGLGNTIDEIKNIKAFKTIEKTTFSAWQQEEFKQEVNKTNNKNIVLFGIETHICVYQTALDLIKHGYNVYIVADCCTSRKKHDNDTALNLLAQEGAKIITVETVIFDFLKSSSHKNFKEIQTLII